MRQKTERVGEASESQVSWIVQFQVLEQEKLSSTFSPKPGLPHMYFKQFLQKEPTPGLIRSWRNEI